MKFKDLTEEQKALLRSLQGIKKDTEGRLILEKVQEFSFQGKSDDDIIAVIAVLTVQLWENRTFLEMHMLGYISKGITFDSILEELKGRKGVLQKILLNQDCRLLRFAIANKKIEAFQSILEAIKDDKEILKEVLIAKKGFSTLLDECIYRYDKCNDYQSKSEEDKKIEKERYHSYLKQGPWDYTEDEDFKIAKEFIEIILNSARENEILEDILTAYGMRKDLAKKVSDGKHSNDVIINVLQKNEKALMIGCIVGVTSCFVTLLSLALVCSKFPEVGIVWSFAISIGLYSGVLVAACTIGYGTYKLIQPNTEMLATDANQKVGSKLPCKAESSIIG